MQLDTAYKFFSDQLMRHETLTTKSGSGGLSYYKSGVLSFQRQTAEKSGRPGLCRFPI